MVAHNKNKLYFTAGVATVTSLALGFCTTLSASADSVVTPITITVPSSCTLSSTIDSPHTISVNIDSYHEDIGKTTIKAVCNDPSGYAIYAIGFTGDSYTGTNHTKLVGANSGETIATGLATSGPSSNWAMKLTKVTDSTLSYLPSNLTIVGGFDDYSLVPDTFTKVVDYTSATDTTLGSLVETTYSAFVSAHQPADTYTGQVKYVLVHPNTIVAGQYNIAYNANGGTGTMATSQNLYNFEPFVLSANAFTPPAGYEFAGWCTTNTSQYACTDGISYADGATVSNLGNTDTTVNLYATWRYIPTMQEFSSSDFESMLINETRTLRDARDSQTYTVAKLKDGNVWMTSNLDLAGGTVIDSNLSDVPAGYTLPTANGFQGGNKLPVSSATSTDWQDSNTAYLYNSNNTTCASNTPCYSYYSWITATAGSGVGLDTDQIASASICPKGWRLPTSNRIAPYTSSEAYNLMYQYGLTNGGYIADSTTTPTGADVFANMGENTVPNFIRAGRFDDGDFLSGGNSGFYQTSTASSATSAYLFDIYYTRVNAAGNVLRRGGLSVRCIFNN